MRDNLAHLEGIRWTFRGVFARFGQKTFRGKIMPTVLMREIRNAAGEMVADHLWFSLTKEFAQVNPLPGERLQFDARVAKYRKRDRNVDFDDLDDDRPRFTIDYKLSHPTRIKRVEGVEQIGDLPLFKQLTAEAQRR